MFSANTLVEEVDSDAFPLTALSYKWAAVATLNMRIAPLLLEENFDELESLGRPGGGGARSSGRPPVLLAADTFRCRRSMVPIASSALSPRPPPSATYYVPAYKLMVSPVLHTTYLSAKTLVNGKDEEAPHTDCMTPLRVSHPECLCFPVQVQKVWEKSAGNLLYAKSVKYEGTQERKYLRFYARAGAGAHPAAAPPGTAAAAPAAPAAKAKTTHSKPVQPCVVDGVTYNTPALHEAFLRVAWGAWLTCEPDAREYRLLAATARGDEASAHDVMQDMRRQGDDAPTNARARDGKTALHLAALHGMVGTLSELFDTYYKPPPGFAANTTIPDGAALDPSIRDAAGSTALHDAILGGSVDAAIFIILSRAFAVPAPGLKAVPLNARDASGDTPLHLAASRGLLPVVKALVAAGAATFPSNAARKTPADVARENARAPVIAFLAYYAKQRALTAAGLASRPGVADQLLRIIEPNALLEPANFVRDQLRARMLAPPSNLDDAPPPAVASSLMDNILASSRAQAPATPRFAQVGGGRHAQLAAALRDTRAAAQLAREEEEDLGEGSPPDVQAHALAPARTP